VSEKRAVRLAVAQHRAKW